MTELTGISPTARWFLIVAGVFALLVAGAIVTVSVYISRAREARVAALEAIRARGEPVFVEDLLEELPRGDPETVEWALACEEIPDLWELVYVQEEGKSDETLLTELQAAGRTAEELALLRAWLDCLEVEPEVEIALYLDDWNEIRLRDLPRPEDVTPCELVAIEAAMELSPQCLEHALLASDLGPVDVRGELERMKAGTPDGELEIFPRHGTGAILGVKHLSNAAVIASLEGDPDEALHLLEVAFHTAGLWRGQPHLIGHVQYHCLVDIAGQRLERILPDLPEDADLTKIEAFYEAFDPRADLRQALVGERAFINRIFQQLRDGEFAVDELGGRPRGHAFEWFALDFMVDVNQTEYLELMDLVLAECAKPRFDPTEKADAVVRERLEGTWNTLFTSEFVPKVSNQHTAALAAEVSRDLALTAILAHREGLEAARAELAGRIDPFFGAAYHTRVESDGTFVMWSVGYDGEDDGAQWDEEYEDLVWRYRPRK